MLPKLPKPKRIKFPKEYSKRELKNIIDQINLQLNEEGDFEPVTTETVTNVKTHKFKFVHIYKADPIFAFKYKCQICNIIMVITDERAASFRLSRTEEFMSPCCSCKTAVMLQNAE